jgi:hypothetical protein
MLERKVRMGRPREVKGGGCQMTFYMNSDRVNDFRKLCDELGLSVSEGIRQLMEQELEKNEIGQSSNPISVNFGLNYSTAKRNSLANTMDYYIEKGLVTKQHIKEEIKGKPLNQLERISAFGRTINATAELEIGYVKTGKYTIH